MIKLTLTQFFIKTLDVVIDIYKHFTLVLETYVERVHSPRPAITANRRISPVVRIIWVSKFLVDVI